MHNTKILPIHCQHPKNFLMCANCKVQQYFEVTFSVFASFFSECECHYKNWYNPGFILMCRLHHEVQRDKLNSDQAEAHDLQILTYNIH